MKKIVGDHYIGKAKTEVEKKRRRHEYLSK